MQYGNGSILSPYDIRDYGVAASTAAPLPETFELDFSNIEVKNQRNINSCVAHALSTILEYHAKGQYELSTNFFYGIQYKLCGYEGKGMYLRNACKIATEYGDPLREDCYGNYEIPDCRKVAEAAFDNEETMRKAADFKTKSYYKCNNNEEIKYALVNYGPILASIQWYPDYTVRNGILVKSSNKKSDSYHAIVIYGYNEQGFLCQNSWGRFWGNNGRFILPYNIKIQEARGLIDFDNQNYIAPPKPNKFLNYIYKILNYIINLFKKYCN